MGTEIVGFQPENNTDSTALPSVIVVAVNHHFQFSNLPYKTTRIAHGYKNIQFDEALGALVSGSLKAYLDGHQGRILLAVRSP